MKREIRFIFFNTALGAFSGLLIAFILFSVAAPSGDMLLTPRELADAEPVGRISSIARAWFSSLLFRSVTAGLGILSFAWFLAMINPRIFRDWRTTKGVAKRVTTIVLSLILASVLEVVSGPLFLVPLVTALLWFAAGETGWAGDFSSWGMGGRDGKARPGQTLLLGALFGLVLWGMLQGAAWLGRTYLLLVSEVLDRSGEISYLGFKLLAAGLTAVCALGMAIAAGLAAALSPTARSGQERLRLAVFPVLLSAFCVLVIGIGYRSFSEKYDLDKTTLSQAAGLSARPTAPVRAVVVLKSLQEQTHVCTLQTTASAGILPETPVDISYDNMKKLEDYLGKHPSGSVFRYAAVQTLINGYGMLWDVPRAMEWANKSASDTVLPRHIMLSKLAVLPVTEKNREYLQLFADEGRWQVSPKNAGKIAAAFEHFGMSDKAAFWRKKTGQETGGLKQPSIQPALMDGVIEGKVIMNGAKQEKARIGLFQNKLTLDKIDAWTLARYVVAAQDPDPTGAFRFERLGAGEYLLAVMTSGEMLMENSRVRVENAPGVINLAKGAALVRLKTIRLDVNPAKP